MAKTCPWRSTISPGWAGTTSRKIRCLVAAFRNSLPFVRCSWTGRPASNSPTRIIAAATIPAGKHRCEGESRHLQFTRFKSQLAAASRFRVSHRNHPAGVCGFCRPRLTPDPFDFAGCFDFSAKSESPPILSTSRYGALNCCACRTRFEDMLFEANFQPVLLPADRPPQSRFRYGERLSRPARSEQRGTEQLEAEKHTLTGAFERSGIRPNSGHCPELFRNAGECRHGTTRSRRPFSPGAP